jgi:carbon monoxide dehydrogenase subunit G
MKLAIKDRQPPVSTTVVGKGTGLASAVDMVTSFTLESAETAETAETIVHWQADVTISGKLAAFGPQGLLDRVARKNIDTFIEGIRSGLTESTNANPEP